MGRKTYELEIAGLGVRTRVARSRELVARGSPVAAVALRDADQPAGALPDADVETAAQRRPAVDAVEQAIFAASLLMDGRWVRADFRNGTTDVAELAFRYLVAEEA